ncbi:MAG: hypothetical protein FWD78_17645 [Treponema sp.]|nr:hypothetical protein [Treponema sp.]
MQSDISEERWTLVRNAGNMWNKPENRGGGGGSAVTDAASRITERKPRSEEIAGKGPNRYVPTAAWNFSRRGGTEDHGVFAATPVGWNGGKNITEPIRSTHRPRKNVFAAGGSSMATAGMAENIAAGTAI